jgi:hypothetical protein
MRLNSSSPYARSVCERTLPSEPTLRSSAVTLSSGVLHHDDAAHRRGHLDGRRPIRRGAKPVEACGRVLTLRIPWSVKLTG